MKTSRSAPGTPRNRVVALETGEALNPKLGWPGPTTFEVMLDWPVLVTLWGFMGAMDTGWNGVPPGDW
jgi:hypothetical protein